MQPPPPPKSVTGPEREAWVELSRQVAAARTYTVANYSAFRLAVKALAAVYAAPAGLKPATLRGLLESASRLLGRFGLDPVTGQAIDVPPPPPSDDDERIQELLDNEFAPRQRGANGGQPAPGA